MKTSNKLLFSAGAGLMMGFIVFLISLKSSLVETKRLSVEGNGISKIEIKVDTTLGNTFVLSEPFEYKLDPNSTSISIEAEETLLPYLKVNDEDDVVRVSWTEQYMTRAYSLPLIVTFGTSGKNVLTFKMRGHITVNTLDVINADLITVKADDDVKGNLKINAKTAEFKMDDNVDLSIFGGSEVVNVDMYDNAKLRGNNFNTKTAIFDLDGNAEVFFQTLNFGSGSIRGNSAVHTGSDPKLVKVKTRDNAEVKAL